MRSERIRRHVRNGTPGPMGNWCINQLEYQGERVYDLIHYHTRMLRWKVDRAGKCHALIVGTGHGSVTDQQIMNAVFDELRLPYWFSRRGGARIVETDN